MKYEWTPPIMAKGDRASFLDAHGNQRTGVCRMVETRYDHTGKAGHVYEMAPDGCKRRRHVGQAAIIAVLR